MGFKSLFIEADKNNNGLIKRVDFPVLIDGYFNSKHMKITKQLYDEYFKKIDLNQDGLVSFEDYDVFIRIAYESEYLPAIEAEINRRKVLKEM